MNKILLEPIKKNLESLKKIPKRIGIGLSGGLDSTMLSLAMSNVAKLYNIQVYLLHINHSIQIDSDLWAKNAKNFAKLLKYKFLEVKVDININKGSCLEEAAREYRYLAFKHLSIKHDINTIFLAHHRDDQAETILLRLLRGTGVTGSIAMRECSIKDNIVYIRPWLNIDKKIILENSKYIINNKKIILSEDPMNYSTNYTRSAIRVLISPILNKKWHGWQKNLTRFSKNMEEALEILNSVAQDDLNLLDFNTNDYSFSLEKWRHLSQSRRNLLIRHWLNIQNIMMPSRARLLNLNKQLMNLHNLGYDRFMVVKHEDVEICCTRNRIFIRSIK
ncbi:tRNA(Ile)-lysidine synthase [Candidatus Kinetoplastibacterium sorsogonicusi]|uniref:tRNA(Ile)-lysidine synthase n=1 Tax=Candidatus Kinetoplastidibacterium kentomonadis TaxID=1576550 RepID=A0A3S7J9G0_9PROT|nr:tRNA lysidine(34) synthetase TilS [Candidatus Kinetoplastibacterium sorsogonicusi]AWD32299.1 tRNA(Ile)-lysidine synthase [Candidatus Kinetoplastibacterium sorsogonicusi]